MARFFIFLVIELVIITSSCLHIVKKMEDVKDVYTSELKDSIYVRPFRFHFTQDRKQKNRDILEIHDSVAILIFHVTRKAIVFVKQFRPAVYYYSVNKEDRRADTIDTKKYPPHLGVTLEVCAGIVDKNLSLEQIACEEVFEECGYKVTPENLELISTYRSGVGTQGSTQTMFYVEVTDDMKVHEGGGINDEIIELVEMSIPEVEKIIRNPPVPTSPLPMPPSSLLAIVWFLHFKADKWPSNNTCIQ